MANACLFLLLVLLFLPICSGFKRQQQECWFLHPVGKAQHGDDRVSPTTTNRARFQSRTVWDKQRRVSSSSLSSSSSSSAAFIIGVQHSTTRSFQRPKSQRLAANVPLPTVSSTTTTTTPSQILPPLEDEISPFPQFQKGTEEGLFVVDTYRVPPEGVDVSQLLWLGGTKNYEVTTANATILLDPSQLQRLEITNTNLTLAVALMMWDPTRYPSLSRARKACRQGKIVFVQRHYYNNDDDEADDALGSLRQPPPVQKGKVIDRLYPGDVIGRQDSQTRIQILKDMNDPENDNNTTASTQVRVWKTLLQTTDMINLKRPPFRLGVVYEDDFMAIVHKPAGVLVYAEGGKGMNNVRFAALQVLQPPSSSVGVEDVLDRPEPVHRLDYATSGLLVLGKTKASVTHLAQQFEFRRAQKAYTAIVRGIPDDVKHNPNSQYTYANSQRLTHEQALERGYLTADFAGCSSSHDMDHRRSSIMDHDTLVVNDNADDYWNLLHTVLDGKNATTLWRVMGVQRNLNNTFVSVLQLVPKTGRYHQLRRHMAWIYNTPIVGDPIHDTMEGDNSGGSSNHDANHNETTIAVGSNDNDATNSSTNTGRGRYHRGLMLCANRIRLLHPFYNTEEGRKEWNKAKEAAVAASKPPPTEVEEDDTHIRIQKYIAKGELYESEHDGIVYMDVSIDLPEKFQKCLEMAEKRAKYNT